MARFAAVQADAADLFLQRGFTQVQHSPCRVGDGKKPARGLVHAHIGGLGTEQHRDQKFEHCRVHQFGGRGRVGDLQDGKKLLNVPGAHVCRHD